jgi:hypothetical protein
MKKTLLLTSLLTATSLYSMDDAWKIKEIDWEQFNEKAKPPVTLRWVAKRGSFNLHLAVEERNPKLLQYSFSLEDFETKNLNGENPLDLATRLAKEKTTSIKKTSANTHYGSWVEPSTDKEDDTALKLLNDEKEAAEAIRNHLNTAFNNRMTELLEANFARGRKPTQDSPPPSH